MAPAAEQGQRQSPRHEQGSITRPLKGDHLRQGNEAGQRWTGGARAGRRHGYQAHSSATSCTLALGATGGARRARRTSTRASTPTASGRSTSLAGESAATVRSSPTARSSIVGGGQHADRQLPGRPPQPERLPRRRLRRRRLRVVDFGGARTRPTPWPFSADGKIVVAGVAGRERTPRSPVSIRTARSTAASPWAEGACSTIGPNVGSASRRASVEVDRDGKIVVAGQRPRGEFTLTRLNPDGGFDATVDVRRRAHRAGPAARAHRPDATLFVNRSASSATARSCWRATSPTDLSLEDVYAIAATRSDLDGSLDSAFGMGGRVAADSWRTSALRQHDPGSARRTVVLLGADAPSSWAPRSGPARSGTSAQRAARQRASGRRARARSWAVTWTSCRSWRCRRTARSSIGVREGSQTYIRRGARCSRGARSDATFGGTGQTRSPSARAASWAPPLCSPTASCSWRARRSSAEPQRDLFVARLEGDPVAGGGGGPVGGGPGGRRARRAALRPQAGDDRRHQRAPTGSRARAARRDRRPRRQRHVVGGAGND